MYSLFCPRGRGSCCNLGRLAGVRGGRHALYWRRQRCGGASALGNSVLIPTLFSPTMGDVDYLDYKMSDGRTFWGIDFVLRCLCCPMAGAVAMEQSETIVADDINSSHRPAVTALEFRTSKYGDA